MGTIARIGLIVYIIYIPVFIVLLILAAKRHKGLVLANNWISNLGDTRFPSGRLFNVSLFLYGFFSIFLIINLYQFLPNLFISKIAVLLMCLSSFSTMMTSLVPLNKNIAVHHAYSNMIYGSMVGFLLLLLYPLYVIKDFPRPILALNILILCNLTLFAVAYLPIERRLGKIPESMVTVRKEEKSFIIRNAAIWQWMFLALSTCWNFFMAIATLRLLS
jgi:hypothetical membrane protein